MKKIFAEIATDKSRWVFSQRGYWREDIEDTQEDIESVWKILLVLNYTKSFWKAYVEKTKICVLSQLFALQTVNWTSIW